MRLQPASVSSSMSSAYGQMGETDRGRRTCTLTRSHNAQWGVGTGGAEQVHALSCLALLAQTHLFEVVTQLFHAVLVYRLPEVHGRLFLGLDHYRCHACRGPSPPRRALLLRESYGKGERIGNLTDALRTLAAPQRAGVGTCALTARS